MGPNLASKTYKFLTFSHQEPKKPDGNPKSPSKPALDASRTLRNLEDELLDVENLHFSAPRLLKTQKITENIGFGYAPRLRKNYFKIDRFCTLLGRSWENLLFWPKNLILATHPEFAKFVSKSIDSGHFWADPGKICFLNPKTWFWPPTQNWQNLCQNLSILDNLGRIDG